MFSKVVRRTHMYLALFLTPWVLIYTLSTFVMNHRDWFRGRPAAPPRWEKTAEMTYPGEFPSGADRFQMARQILATLDMDGTHQSNQRNDGTLVIQRLGAVNPQRITYTPADRKLVVEKQVFENAFFLERMHRRRGYQHPYALEDAWAFTVDLFIAATIAWALSGLWMFWEMKVTRRLGALAMAAGIALFGIFLKVL